MKKLILFFIVLISFISANAQIIEFPPGSQFKLRLLAMGEIFECGYAVNEAGQQITVDLNNDNEIDVSEALLVYEFHFFGDTPGCPWGFGLSGIENFTNLREFSMGQMMVTGVGSLNSSSLVNLKRLQLSESFNLQSLIVDNLIGLEVIICINCLSLIEINVDGLVNLHTLNLWESSIPEEIDCSSLWSLETLNISTSQYSGLKDLNLKNGAQEEVIGLVSNYELLRLCVDDNEVPFYQDLIDNSNLDDAMVSSYCNFNPGGEHYTIQGGIRYDDDGNGCDVLDYSFSNLVLEISDGSNTGFITPNNNGEYIAHLNSGEYTITSQLDNPDYFTISPSSFLVSFPIDTSPFIQDFCVIPNGDHSDLEVNIFPITVARPGFPAKYRIVYSNKGTTIISGTTTLTYESNLMNLNSSDPTYDSQTFNSFSWDYTDLHPFESRVIDATFIINTPSDSPPVNIGNELTFMVNIDPTIGDETPEDNNYVFDQIVVGSLDPNDKTCLQGIKMNIEEVGNYVEYIIRFENTGNYLAENVVIKDHIDGFKFDLSSIRTISASHDFNVLINNHDVEFIFEGINLPFEDELNDGYIVFKIKTLPDLIVGDSFTNNAEIYFDYNLPIETNTTYTEIDEVLGLSEIIFKDNFTLHPNPTIDYIEIINKGNVEITSVEIYNMRGQVILAIPQKTNSINVSRLKAGNYIIKLHTNQGTTYSKFIRK